MGELRRKPEDGDALRFDLRRRRRPRRRGTPAVGGHPLSSGRIAFTISTDGPWTRRRPLQSLGEGLRPALDAARHLRAGAGDGPEPCNTTGFQPRRDPRRRMWNGETARIGSESVPRLSLIHISEPTRLGMI